MERKKIALTYSKLSRMMSLQGVTVVIATIALFKEIHTWNRKNIPGYIEVFLDVPLTELFKRDPKGIYKRAKSGKLKNVAGLDLEVDFPESPDLHFKFSEGKSSEELKEIILSYLEK